MFICVYHTFTVDSYSSNDALYSTCQRGARFIIGWSCSERKENFQNRTGLPANDATIQALYKCCVASAQAEGRLAGGEGGAPLPEADYKDVDVRSDFRESFLWEQGLIDLG